MRRSTAVLTFIVLALLCVCRSAGVKETEPSLPIACIALSSADDSMAQLASETFAARMEFLGYETRVGFCENVVESQLRQIQNFMALGAEIIAVDCVGNSEAYEEIFSQARQQGCKVMVLNNAAGTVENCDLQASSSHILKGMRMCELLKQFLDEQYRDAPPKSVNVLFLGMTNKIENIRMCAGYQLICEKYLRYYDYNQTAFIAQDTGEEIFYLNEQQEKRLVDEPTGGLILDEHGLAQLNPFYDERVTLYYGANKNVSTNLEGQSAIDAFMLTSEGQDLRVVLALSGNAGIGAAERMKYYSDTKLLTASPEQLAVFGSDDTYTNRSLMSQSMTNQSLFRGFVCAENMEIKIYSMVEILLGEKGHIYHVTDSSRSLIIPETRAMGVVNVNNSLWRNPDIFFEKAEES